MLNTKKNIHRLNKNFDDFEIQLARQIRANTFNLYRKMTLSLYCTKIIKMNTFENFILMKKVFFFTSQLSSSYPFASWEEKRKPITMIITAFIHINRVYVETLSFVCCENTNTT